MKTITHGEKFVRNYTDLIKLKTFNERFEYLNLIGQVGAETFGFDRYLNQILYHSDQWRSIRDYIIVRDCGCDMALSGYEIYGQVYVHHMNPITKEDLLTNHSVVFDPEFLVCVSGNTHRAIHYGDESTLNSIIPERTQNDTCPWKKGVI